MTATAVVFAYSEVGARCLQALYDAGVSVPLVVTHEDDPNENRWFASVAEIARAHGSRTITPPGADDPALHAELSRLAPDFVFSFYYRKMLPAPVLGCALRAALNMHGSLLPKYRGRAPVNWAVLNGETETGASLHHMVAKPDAGDLVDQQAVPIGPDDTAFDVAKRVADAAVIVLTRSLPALVAGTARATPLDLRAGSYFGGRKPADGEFRWDWPAKRIHDLVRAVAPPFPGAFARVGADTVRVFRTVRDGEPPRFPALAPCLYADGERLIADCVDGVRLVIADARLVVADRLGAAAAATAPDASGHAAPTSAGTAAPDEPFDARTFVRRHGHGPLPLAANA